MLTANHLRIYEVFGGDIDAFSRSGDASEIGDAEWGLIDRLRQDLHLVSSGLASEQFSERVRAQLLAVTESENVRSRLWALSEKA